jgi:hypothetical protein
VFSSCFVCTVSTVVAEKVDLGSNIENLDLSFSGAYSIGVLEFLSMHSAALGH